MGIMTALAYCYELTISKYQVYHFIMDVMITDANGTFWHLNSENMIYLLLTADNKSAVFTSCQHMVTSNMPRPPLAAEHMNSSTTNLVKHLKD